MIKHIKSDSRGRADHGWLRVQHAFSFAGYYNPNRMGFRSLRVLNEDHIAGGGAFPLHPHRDMEILTYIISGGLAHEDSMGNGAVIEAGEFQMMSAGTGVYHSEANASTTDEVHVLQIWLEPNKRGVSPSYAQRRFDDRENQLRRVASQDGADGAFRIQQDAEVFTSLLKADDSIEHPLASGRHAWLQLIHGCVLLNSITLEVGDSVEVSDERELLIHAVQDSEFMLFDLA